MVPPGRHPHHTSGSLQKQWIKPRFCMVAAASHGLLRHYTVRHNLAPGSEGAPAAANVNAAAPAAEDAGDDSDEEDASASWSPERRTAEELVRTAVHVLHASATSSFRNGVWEGLEHACLILQAAA